MQIYLTRHCCSGHNVTTAENGAEALQLMTSQIESDDCEHPFDVVLMDLQMPIMDGLEATERLRKLETSLNNVHVNGPYATLFHQLIIGCSANSDNDTMKAAFVAGIDDFIPKPFKIQSFHEMYNKLLTVKAGRN